MLLLSPRRKTFQEERLSMWLRDIKEFCKENALIILIGNKRYIKQLKKHYYKLLILIFYTCNAM